MGLLERAERVGTSAGVGGLVGGGIGALVGGVGAAPGAILGMAGGAVGEMFEQAASVAGMPRGAQVISGLVSGAGAPELARLGKEAIVHGLGHPVRTARALSELVRSSETSERTSAFRSREVDRARTALGGSQGSAEDIGKTVLDSLKAKMDRAKQWAGTSEKTRLQAADTLRNQADRIETQLAEAQLGGTGKQVPNLGEGLRTTVLGRSAPMYLKMQNDYKAAYEPAMAAAKQSETAGNYWADTPGAREVRAKWEEIANGSSKGVASDIRYWLDDIWRKGSAPKDPFGYPLMDEAGKAIPGRESFLPATGIDQVVRQLGDVGYKEGVEGAKAIGRTMAAELRSDIVHGVEKAEGRAGGFYEWSGLGSAKEGYAKNLEGMQDFKSKRGRKIAGTDANVYGTDAKSLPKAFMESEAGISELKQMVGNDAQSSAFIQQYTHNELAGKSVPQIRKWAADHPQLMQDPSSKAIVDGQLNRLSSLESSARVIRADAEMALAASSRYPEAVKTAAKEWMAKVGVVKLQQDPQSVILSAFSSPKLSGEQLKAISGMITNVPQARAKFGESLAYHLSQKSPEAMVQEMRRLTPALEGSGLISKTDIVEFKQKVAEVAAAAKSLPPTERTRIITEWWKKFRVDAPIRAAGAAAGMGATRALFEDAKK